MKFKDQSVVITGGGSGIGWAMTEAFYREGAKVYVLEIDAGAAQDRLKEEGWTSKVHCLSCDVSQLESVRQCFDQIIAESGKVDIFINNAGVANIGTALSSTVDNFDRVFLV